jgi:hypothetical protein
VPKPNEKAGITDIQRTIAGTAACLPVDTKKGGKILLYGLQTLSTLRTWRQNEPLLAHPRKNCQWVWA